jgi:hypothetical protein
MLNESLKLLWKFLGSEYDDVSQFVFKFAHQYLGSVRPECFFFFLISFLLCCSLFTLFRYHPQQIKKNEEPSEEQMLNLRNMLAIISNKMKFDTSYQVEKKSEDQEQFLEYRKVFFLSLCFFFLILTTTTTCTGSIETLHDFGENQSCAD